MTVKVQQAELNKALALVASAVASRATLPVLSNILIQASLSSLSLAATDLEVALTMSIPASADEPFDLTIPAKKLLDTVGLLPEGEVFFEPGKAGRDVRIISGKLSNNFKGIDAQEFPHLATLDPAKAVALDLQAFCAVVNSIAFNAATDQARPVLTAVKVSLSPQADHALLTMEAADGFRLGRRSVKLPLPKGLIAPMEALVPAKSLTMFADRVGKGREGEVSLSMADGRLILLTNGILMSAQTVQGNFPQLTAVIPTNSPITFSVSIPELRRALKLAEIIASEAAHTVRMEYDAKAKTIQIKAVAAETGDNDSIIPVGQANGDSLVIAINGKYLLASLAALPQEVSDEALISLATATSPVLVGPSVMAADNEAWLYVMMPMHLGK